MESLVLGLLVLVVYLLFFKKDSKAKSATELYSKAPAVTVTVRGQELDERLDKNPESFWIPPGEAVEVDGDKIPGGLLYVGEGLAACHGYGPEPSLINDGLPVSFNAIDRDGDLMGYWPSYSQISPASRAAYLQWLAGGRVDPDIGIGYVFLFFYGLERRCFFDAERGHVPQEEVEAIYQEVVRLRGIYAEKNRSFDGYSSRFLAAHRLAFAPDSITKEPPELEPEWLKHCEELIKFVLGVKARAGEPLPVEWALAWLYQDRDISLRTPARRCKDEFQALFRIRYAERFGDGLTIRPGNSTARFAYKPASSSLSSVKSLRIYKGPALPDILALRKPRRTLQELAESVTKELESYSRFIGPECHGKDSLPALATLPAPLASKHEAPKVVAFREQLLRELGDQDVAEIPGSLIFDHFPSKKPGQMTKKESVQLAQVLEVMGLGILPDVRFTNHKPDIDAPIVIFRLGDDAPDAPTKEFELAALLLRLSVMVALADGEFSEDEERHLERQLETGLALEPGERERLRAHLTWLPADTQARGMAGLKKRVEALDLAARNTIGGVLLKVVSSDGKIDPKEISTTEKIYRLLGLDTDSIYSQAHAAAVEPVTVRPARKEEQDYTIPHPAPSAVPQPRGGDRAALNQAALERKQRETEQVKSLLSGIFSEDDERSEAEDRVGKEEAGSDVSIQYAGLDQDHSRFVSALIQRNTWTRNELESLASRHHLLLAGALDTINEAALDLFGAPLLEEDEDGFEIERETVQEMTA